MRQTPRERFEDATAGLRLFAVAVAGLLVAAVLALAVLEGLVAR